MTIQGELPMAGVTVRAVDGNDPRAIVEIQRFYRHYATIVDGAALVAELASESAALAGPNSPYAAPGGRLFYAEWVVGGA